ncbi:MAG: glycosyltransferase family 39 protein [Chitinophagales bacterium]
MKLLLNNSSFKSGLLITTIILCCIPLFAKLGVAPIYMWDEATYANNALDMYQSNDLIVVRMEGQPDLYNTKPPFVLWMQTISLHTFGLNEFAIRFPSALFALLTILVLLWFSLAVFDSVIIAIVSMLTLVSANGYVAIHVTRSGDLDATLVFWITLYVFIFLKYILKPSRPGLHFFLMAVGITGAFLTKGIAGWLPLPLLLIVAIADGSFLKLLRQKAVYMAAAIVFLLSGSYYLLREIMSPGYWTVVYASELMRFNNTVMSWHVQPFAFYFLNMLHGSFIPFLYLLPFSWLIFLFEKEKIMRRCVLYLWILSLGYFLLISYPADKLEWYDAPLYPLMSLIIALFIYSVIKKIGEHPYFQSRLSFKNSITVLILFAVLGVPYWLMVKKVLATDDITYSWDRNQSDEFRITGAFMKFLKEKHPEIRSYTILKSPPKDPEHYDQLKFYQRTYQLLDHFSIIIKNNPKELEPGEIVMTCEPNLQEALHAIWTGRVIQSWKGCDLFQVLEPNKTGLISSPVIQ